MRRAWCVLIFSTLCAVQSWPQSCPLPPTLLPVPREKNIFTDQQESDLGDIVADSLVRDESVVQDDALSAHLRAIASRVVPYLPENHLRLQFSLIELPDANAFSLPGGRVYVSRKLIASLRNDDELAGIIAHELGHIITHQAAISISQEFRQVLGVYAVTDRADIAERLQRDRETWAAHKLRAHDSEDLDQQVADQVALYVMARAGFKLQAFADALDRTSDTRGKTGNWVTDLFRTTKPEQKRLREAIREIGMMPAACIAAPSPGAADTAFADWQSQVIAYNQPEGHEQLTGVVLRRELAQPLRPNIFNFRFSPNGKYILAQDEGGIHVLSREPLKNLFFIAASNALRAFFTPDSTSIVFYTPSLRIETWNIGSQKRVLVREMALNVSCMQTALAPDGKSLACYDEDGNLWLFDTASGNSIVERKNFFQPSPLAFLNIMLAKAAAESAGSDVEHETPFLFVNMGFSPDARYFLAGSSFLAGFENNTYAYDLAERHEAATGHGVRAAIRGQFVFLRNDQIVAIDQLSPSKSPVISFPSGEKIGQLRLATEAYLRPSSDGKYLIVGPSKDFALVVLDVKSPESFLRVKLDAADEYDGCLVFEQGDGAVGTMDISSQKMLGSLVLEHARLSSSSAITISPDLAWLAASSRTRGAVWNLNTDQRVLQVRGFHSGWFSDAKSFFGDFPKSKDQERSIIKIDFAAASPQASKIRDLSKSNAQQFGHYLLVTADDSKSYHKNLSFDLQDFITGKSVWSHDFTKSYPAGKWDTDDQRVLFWWGVWQNGVKEEMKKYPDLQHTAKPDDYFVEIFDMQKGDTTSALLVNTNEGSFRVTDCAFRGDWVAVTTKDERVITYSLSSGKEAGHVFGSWPMLSPLTNTLTVMLSDTIMDVYDLTTTNFRTRLKFSTPVIFRAFSQDEKKMFVMTSDQTYYILDLSGGVGSNVASSSSTAH